MMKRTKRFRAVAAAAGGVMLAMVGSVSAQYRISTGNVLDANPRIGSGGYNENPDTRLGHGVTGNDIVTGNVTGG